MIKDELKHYACVLNNKIKPQELVTKIKTSCSLQ